MSTLFIVVTALKITVALTAAWTIFYWHISTKGAWRKWPAGRSLMSLLAIICIGYCWRVVNRLVPDYALEEPLLGMLYICFSIALIRISRTIRKELAAAKTIANAGAHPAGAGATNTEEKPDGKL